MLQLCGFINMNWVKCDIREFWANHLQHSNAITVNVSHLATPEQQDRWHICSWSASSASSGQYRGADAAIPLHPGYISEFYPSSLCLKFFSQQNPGRYPDWMTQPPQPAPLKIQEQQFECSVVSQTNLHSMPNFLGISTFSVLAVQLKQNRGKQSFTV